MDKNLEEKTPLVSILMAAFNADNFIGDSIKSIIEQTYKNWELIVIDDYSSDKTYQIANNYSKLDPRIKVIRNTTQLGQALSRNRGVEYSTGNYIAILDSDDLALPFRIEKQVEYLGKNSDVGLVGSYVNIIDKDGKKIRTKEKACDALGIHFALILQNQFIHSSVIMRREVVEWAHGYDTKYLHAEDYDLWSRLCDKFILVNMNTVLTSFRVHNNSVTSISSSQKVQINNALEINLRNARKYLPNISKDNIILLSRLVNNRGYNIFNLARGLVLYRQLCLSYIRRNNLNKEQESHIKMIWKNTLVNTIAGIVKTRREKIL